MNRILAFGIPATIGLAVSLFILYRMWWKKRLLIKQSINGAKLLIVNRDLGTVRLLAIVEFTFFLAFITAVLDRLIILPGIASEAIVWYLISGSMFVSLAIIHIQWAQAKVDRAVEAEITGKGNKVGDVVTIEVTGKVAGKVIKEGGESNGVETSEVTDGTEGPDQ